MKDKEIKDLIKLEELRQKNTIELIASENFVSKDILEAAGSVLTNKYAEGYPNKRYYGGCKYVDQIEELAIKRAKIIFKADNYHVNVQPHSGSSANMAVYKAVLANGDTILSMDLNSGGHLTHGSKVSFSGKDYNIVHYGLNKRSEYIDYKDMEEKAFKYKPKLIVVGASSYSRIIDFKKAYEIAAKVGAYLMADIAHIAGLIVAGLHPSPVGYADFITTTTHKTLRGPRSGIILCRKDLSIFLDRSVFPGIQGGPLMHMIAAKAICFKEAMSDSFVVYQKRVLSNIKAMEKVFKEKGIRMVSGGSDNHLLLIDTKKSFDLTGLECETKLEKIGITCNKNMIPFDTQKPNVTSGIRIGTAAMTTKGFKEKEFTKIANIIIDCLKDNETQEELTLLVIKVLKAQSKRF